MDNLILQPGHKVLNKTLYAEIDAKIGRMEPFSYLFAGKTGVGKTWLMEAIMQSLLLSAKKQREMQLEKWKNGETNCHPSNIPIEKQFVRVRSEQIWADYEIALGSPFDVKTERLDAINTILHRKFVFLDDLGDEYKNNNKDMRPVSKTCSVIASYYEYWKQNNEKTFAVFTTNLTTEEVAETYGMRTLDRLYEIAERVDFTNESFRIQKFRRRKI